MQREVGLRHVASIFSKGVKSSALHRRLASNRAIPLPPQAAPRHSSQISQPAQKVNPRSQAIPWVLSSILAGGIGLYGALLYVAANKPCQNPAVKELAGQKDVAGRYEETADGFDSEVGLSEVLMGVNRIRKKLARQATGHVLEVSCGTGRNIGYFDLSQASRVESLTFVDLAPQMVEICKRKWNTLVGKNGAQKKGLIVRFLPASALGQMPLAPSQDSEKYDTILQTMGLCSTDAPVELIENMVRYLDVSNPNARIFLLEHGRSYQQWLNNILDNSAERHAEIHGCWFNRDIGALVEEAAAKTGLEVVKERRHHFGTTWVFELKPTAKTLEVQPDSNISSEPTKRTKWFGGYW